MQSQLSNQHQFREYLQQLLRQKNYRQINQCFILWICRNRHSCCLGISRNFHYVFPGLLSIVMFAFNENERENKRKTGDQVKYQKVLVSMVFSPLTIILFPLHNTFTYKGDVHQGYMAIVVAMEAFVKSFLQWFYKTTQLFQVTKLHQHRQQQFAVHFYILSKASIDLDFEVYEHELGFFDIVKQYFALLPVYAATIAFRTLAFAITIAFLRISCLLPMCLLFVEMVSAIKQYLHPKMQNLKQQMHLLIGQVR